MKVTLIDYTGAGSADPAKLAASLLIFTKNTRLEMKAGLLDEIQDWPWEKVEQELSYMARTIPSSWEFLHYTFLIEGVTRAFTHQFVRTRTGSYAQQTMRVLDVKGWDYLMGPTITSEDKRKVVYEKVMKEIDGDYRWLIEDGAAIEDARGILPTNILTNIVASFNMRTLAEMFRKRESLRVQGEYRDVLAAMKAAMIEVHPFLETFFSRTFDAAARELNTLIAGLDIDAGTRTDLVKLVDQMRSSE